MKASLVIRNGPFVPDLAKAEKYGINELVFEAEDPALQNRDPQTGKPAGISLFAALREKGYKIRLMRDPTWSSVRDPLKVAAAMSADIAYYGGGPEVGGSLAQLSMMYDGEIPHDSGYHLAVLREFVRRRPGRSIVWTLEGLQGGWISDDLVDFINGHTLITISPQAYLGDMTPLYPVYVIENLVARGIDRPKIQPFLRHDRLDAGWYGIAYDHSKLA